MEFKLILDKNHREEVVLYAKEINDFVREIESLVKNRSKSLVGYKNREIVILKLDDVICFTIENNKVIAITYNGNYQIKDRLYKIEEIVDSRFIKANQSTLANINEIERFESSFGGTLVIVFKNGYKDYVSRRQLKHVKERLGLKWKIHI